jgi:hypothetical protein
MKLNQNMKFGLYLARAAVIGIAVGLAAMLTGCEDDSFSHKPPDGQGCLIVDNCTSDRLKVFIDGFEATPRVSAYDDEAYDLNPGVYRVVLQERHGHRSCREDVDILEGRQTIMRVHLSDNYKYNTHVYFD